MVKVEVDISELKNEGEDTIRGLTEFLKEKAKANVDTLTDKLTVEGEAFSKKYLRVLLRKFLHKAEIKRYYRIIKGVDESFIVKSRKQPEKE